MYTTIVNHKLVIGEANITERLKLALEYAFIYIRFKI